MEHPNKWDAEQAVRADKTLAIVPMMDGMKVRCWATMPAAEAAPIIEAVRKAIGPLNIELKKIQRAAFASEETNCFNAEVWINGKKAGTAHNQGHGGPTDVDPHSLSHMLDAYGATLPPVVSDILMGGEPFTYQPDAENIVDDLLEEHLKAKDAAKQDAKLKRDLTQKAMWTEKGKKGVYATKKLPPEVLAKFTANPPAKWNVDVLLNTLPFAEAKAVYDANIDTVYR